MAPFGGTIFPALPSATFKRFDNLRATRYNEMFLIGGNGTTKNLNANVYNTPGLNGYETTRDSAPQALVEEIDVKALKKEFDVLGAFVNGPRQWTLDGIDVHMGVQRDFNGLKATWVGKLSLKGMDLKHKGGTAYKLTTIEHKTPFGFRQGKPLFILDDPEGKPWVMKSCGLIIDPTMSYEQLEALGSRLKSAPGWKDRVQVIDQDLILKPERGIAAITQDELGNTYTWPDRATATSCRSLDASVPWRPHPPSLETT